MNEKLKEIAEILDALNGDTDPFIDLEWDDQVIQGNVLLQVCDQVLKATTIPAGYPANSFAVTSFLLPTHQTLTLAVLPGWLGRLRRQIQGRPDELDYGLLGADHLGVAQPSVLLPDSSIT